MTTHSTTGKFTKETVTVLTLLPHKRCVRVADSGWPLPKVELVLPVGGADELVTGRSGIQAAPNIVTENVISPDNTHAAMGHLGLRTMDRMESIPSCGHNGGVSNQPTNQPIGYNQLGSPDNLSEFLFM